MAEAALPFTLTVTDRPSQTTSRVFQSPVGRASRTDGRSSIFFSRSLDPLNVVAVSFPHSSPRSIRTPIPDSWGRRTYTAAR